MTRDPILERVALLHAALVCLLVAALAVAGLPVRGALLGGAVMGASLAFLWAIGRALLVPGRRSAVAMLGALKVLLYLGLTLAVLTGRLVADGAGFAAGVGCFLAAAVIVALAPRTTAAAAG